MCEYSDRVVMLEDLLANPSSSTSGDMNRKDVHDQLLGAILDLCEVRLDAFTEQMKKVEEVLDARQQRSAQG